MKLPKWWGLITPVLVVLFMLTLLPLAAIWMARSTNSKIPRLSIISDMDNQPRYKAQMSSPLFADERSMRRPVTGTVAKGMASVDEHLNLGIVDGEWATTLPPSIQVTPELLRRGQTRFNIYCAVCHGLDGSGQGIIDTRVQELLSADPRQIQQTSWVTPSNYHTEQVLARPVGHIFNTISNGIRTMPAYNKQLDIEDRWAVVAYVRALQRSQGASLEDVPVAEREMLEKLAVQALAEIEREKQEAELAAAAEAAAQPADGEATADGTADAQAVEDGMSADSDGPALGGDS